MAQQSGMRFDKFRQRFQTNESCREYLYQLRWPRGFVCPRCGAAGGYPIKGRSEYSCKHCHKQTSVTAGTVMHRTHLPLTVWFWAMYLVARDKRGISATQLSRELEIAYSSAWYLLQRLRSAWAKETKNTFFPAQLSWMTPISAHQVSAVQRGPQQADPNAQHPEQQHQEKKQYGDRAKVQRAADIHGGAY